MLEDMQIRNLTENSQGSYVRHVACFARHFGRSPAKLGVDDIRAYQLYLTKDKGMAASSITVATAALRFLYTVTLKHGWNVERVMPTPKRPQTLPVILSPEEVQHFLSCVTGRKPGTVLTVCYAAGLRISEAIALTPADIDSQRMTIRVEQGKGRKDRYVMLSERLLAILRDWYRLARPKTWLFPGASPDQPLTRAAVAHACQRGRQRSGLSAGAGPSTILGLQTCCSSSRLPIPRCVSIATPKCRSMPCMESRKCGCWIFAAGGSSATVRRFRVRTRRSTSPTSACRSR